MVAQPVGELDFDDLTARARIRTAALRLFTERGTAAATMRDIAAAAGVSAGLVRHHFGSKEGLRDACDAYALDRLMRIKEQAVLEGQMATPGFLSSVHPTILALNQYLARALLDGSPAAAGIFDEMVVLTEDWLAVHNPGASTDREAHAAVIVAMQVGMLAMRDHLSRALGADILTPEGHLRMARGALDVYAHPLVSAGQAAEAQAAIDDALERRQKSAQQT